MQVEDGAINAEDDLGENNCPFCTFLNAPGVLKCEMCDSAMNK